MLWQLVVNHTILAKFWLACVKNPDATLFWAPSPSRLVSDPLRPLRPLRGALPVFLRVLSVRLEINVF
jgi:hypothetical protein